MLLVKRNSLRLWMKEWIAMNDEEKAVLKHLAVEVSKLFQRCECEFESEKAKNVFQKAKTEANTSVRTIFNNI